MDEMRAALEQLASDLRRVLDDSDNSEAQPCCWACAEKLNGLLTERELQTWALVVRGFSSKQIAQGLHVSRRTVEADRHKLYTKLGIESVPGLVQKAMVHGLLPCPLAEFRDCSVYSTEAGREPRPEEPASSDSSDAGTGDRGDSDRRHATGRGPGAAPAESPHAS